MKAATLRKYPSTACRLRPAWRLAAAHSGQMVVSDDLLLGWESRDSLRLATPILGAASWQWNRTHYSRERGPRVMVPQGLERSGPPPCSRARVLLRLPPDGRSMRRSP